MFIGGAAIFIGRAVTLIGGAIMFISKATTFIGGVVMFIGRAIIFIGKGSSAIKERLFRVAKTKVYYY